MTTIAKDTGEFVLPPEGTFVARCLQVIDLGTQYSRFYDTSSHKVLFGWELPTEVNDTGEEPRPFMIWKRYTLSLNNKAMLRHDLEAWRGKKFSEQELSGFDVRNVVDCCCLITVIHKENAGNTYANVAAVAAVPKGTESPPRVGNTIVFDIDEFDRSIFDTFSDNLQTTILGCRELQAKAQTSPDVGNASDDPGSADDVPF